MRLVRKEFNSQYLTLGFQSKNNYKGNIRIVLKCNGKMIEESKRIDNYLSYNLTNVFINKPCNVKLYLYQNDTLVYYQNFNLIANENYVEAKVVEAPQEIKTEIKEEIIEEVIKPFKLDDRLLTTRDLALKAKAFLLEEGF